MSRAKRDPAVCSLVNIMPKIGSNLVWVAVFWQIRMSHCGKIGHKLNISPTRHPAPLCSCESWRVACSSHRDVPYPQPEYSAEKQINYPFTSTRVVPNPYCLGSGYFLFLCNYISDPFAHALHRFTEWQCKPWDIPRTGRTVCMAEISRDI